MHSDTPAALETPLLRYACFGLLLAGLTICGWWLVGLAPSGALTDVAHADGDKVPSAPKRSDVLMGRGKQLFARNCATCHGDAGKGDGQAAYLLWPRPRDFSEAKFRLVSTDNGIPTDADLYRTITRGMAGSAMPSWAHLTADDRWALVYQVRDLIVEGKVAALLERGLPAARAKKIAARLAKPGQVVEIPKETPSSPEHLARGRQLYVANCAECHDLDGRGRKRLDLKDDKGNAIFARDYTQGVFKGSASGKDLARRLLCGISGTPMPSFTAELANPSDLWAVIHYVQTLVPPGAADRVAQRQLTFVVDKTDRIDTDPNGASWEKVKPKYVALMPLWWRNDRPEGVMVRMVHDGKRLAMHMRWEDATKDSSISGQRRWGDAAAAQFSCAKTPPLFTMGSKANPVTIWHWKAAWMEDAKKYGDVEDNFPRIFVDYYDSLKKPHPGRAAKKGENKITQHRPLFMSGWGAGNVLSNPLRKLSCEQLQAVGFGTLTSMPAKSQQVTAYAKHEGGYWHVVMIRSLKGTDQCASFVPGSSKSPRMDTRVSFAVWDGSAGDRNGQKQVSMWHKLELK